MKNILVIFILGSITSLAMAPTNFWPLIFLGLSALYIYTSKAPTPARAGLYGFIFSFGYFGFSLSWIGNALLIEENPYWWAWPLAITGLPLILSIFTFIFCAIHKKINKKKNGIIPFLSFAIALSLNDLARGNLFTGFPWNLYGYTWIDTPIAQIAGLWDIYLLNTITIFWALTPALIISYRQSKTSVSIITVLFITSILISYIYGARELSAPTNITNDYSVTVIQPNIPQSEKWKPENRAKNFQTLLELSKYKQATLPKGSKTHIIVWPETAISQDLLNSQWVSEYVSKTLSEYSIPTYLITGALRYDGKNYYNSMITINSDGKIINTYDKSHLVPFGEYMPMSNIIDIAPIVGFKGFKKGNGDKFKDIDLPIKITPLICYEIIFPKHTSKKTDLIINATNDAWYGDSAGPRQHLVQTRFRAIESKTRIIRAANTGISAIIDKKGNISSFISLNLQGVILE
jgi:apolipoprotein N-acyltransferase